MVTLFPSEHIWAKVLLFYFRIIWVLQHVIQNSTRQSSSSPGKSGQGFSTSETLSSLAWDSQERTLF